MNNIFVTILYQPIFNLLVWLYNVLPGRDLGLAIIALTLVVRLILYPLNQKSIKSQRALQTLQPKIDAIKAEYGKNKEELGKQMMELYKKEGINPLSSCLPLLIQFPFLIALYAVFQSGLTGGGLDLLYPFVQNPGSLNHIAFGFFDLAQKSIVLALLAAAAQFWQTKMLMGRTKPQAGGMANAMNQQMLYIMPIVTAFIGATLPAGLTLYWLATTVFSIIQQYFLFKKQAAEGQDKGPSSGTVVAG